MTEPSDHVLVTSTANMQAGEKENAIIEYAHIVSDGIILTFEDGTSNYFSAKALQEFATRGGATPFLNTDPSGHQSAEFSAQGQGQTASMNGLS